MTEILSEVSKRVNKKRLKHTVSVAEECERLAEIFDLNETSKKQLYVSALLHDITKQYEVPEQIEMCRKYGIEVSDCMLASPKTFHALTGAYLGRELFPNIVDDTVFENILTHTTGKSDMSLQQKLLYLADYIEPRRTFRDCVKLRKIFYNKISKKGADKLKILDDTLIISLDMTIKDLMKNSKVIDPNTTDARNCLLLQRKSDDT